jgi:hypothetical protein
MIGPVSRHLKLTLFALAIASTGAGLFARRGSADARPGRYVVKPTTVYDTRTRLTWQRDVGISLYTWTEAEDYCKKLDIDGGAWRLPGVKELETLVDESRVNPAIDEAAFPATPAKFFWTDSLVTNFPSNGWTVDFNRGGDNFFPVTSGQLVRCVR